MMMPLRDHELARREEGRVEIRSTPLRARWNFDELAAADGHRVNCDFLCGVRALDTVTERRMLEETFLAGSQSLTPEDVAAHLAPAMREAADQAVRSRPVAEVLSDEARQPILEAIRQAGHRIAFACGLELLPPFQLSADSPTLRQQKLEVMQRQWARERADDQLEHFQQAAERLRQFHALRQSAPQLSAGQVLKQLGSADQGNMLETLLLASANESAAQNLWIASGPYLIKITAGDSPIKPQLIPLPPTLGPLRSVQSAEIDGDRLLLVGARSGVLKVDPNSPAEAVAYADPQCVSPLGFNRAVAWNGDLWACHGEAGIVGWNIDDPSTPSIILRPAALTDQKKPVSLSSGPRNLQAMDESHLIFSSGHQLWTIDRRGTIAQVTSNIEAEIVAIIPDEQHLIVVHEDGTLCRRERATLRVICQERRHGRILAAAALPWLGENRILLAAEEGPIDCVGFDDPLITQYHSPHRGPRMLAADAARIIAVSADRQRLLIWNSWDGQKLMAEIYLTGLTKHRIADVDFT